MKPKKKNKKQNLSNKFSCGSGSGPQIIQGKNNAVMDDNNAVYNFSKERSHTAPHQFLSFIV